MAIWRCVLKIGERARQIFGRHEVGDDGLTRRRLERTEQGEKYRDYVELERCDLTGRRQKRQRRRNTKQARLRHHHQLAPVHRVGQETSEQQNDHLRHRAHEADHADLQWRIRDLIDLPSHRHLRKLAADAGQ